MSELHIETMTAYETRLAGELGALADESIRPVDASAVAGAVAAGGARRRSRVGLRPALSASRMALLAVVTLTVVAVALLVGSGLRDQSPYGLGHLAYELDGDIWLADWDGSNPRMIADGTPAGWHHMDPQWSEDGVTLSLFGHDAASEGPLVSYQADGDGQGLREVGRDGLVNHALSPSGTQRVGYGTRSMVVIGRDGSRVEIPAPEGFSKWNYWDKPSWTPDGSRIIAGACTISDCKSASAHELFSAPLTGAAPTRLTPAGVHDYGGLVSPDGSLVAFTTSPGGAGSPGDAWRVGLVGVDGRDRRLLPGLVYASLSMAWAADSRSLAVTSGEDEGRAIWIVDVDPSVPMRMLTGTEDVGSVLGFSPDGRWILVSWSDGQEDALWRVEVDGDARETIVPGSFEGDWQRVPTDAQDPSATP